MNGLTAKAGAISVGRTAAGATAILCVLCCFGGCSVEKPESPTWDMDLNFPLIDHTYDMLELVDRMADDAIGYDSLGNIAISVNHEIDTVAVDAGLSVQDVRTSYEETLGTVSIASPGAVAERVDLDDYIPLILGYIPEFGFTASQPLPEVSEFESVTIENGDLIVTVVNNFGLSLDSITVTIIDDMFAVDIAEITIEGGMTDGEAVTRTIDLSGKTISNSLSFSADVHSPGGTLFSLGNNELTVEAAFSPTITVSSARAKIPTQEKNYSQNVTFDDDIVITSASIKSGSIELDIYNATNVSAQAEVTIDEFESGGQPLRFYVNLPANSYTVVSTPLDGYTFLPGSTGGHPSTHVSLNVTIWGSGDGYVDIESTDYYAVDVSVTDVEFSSVFGIINPTEVEIDPIARDVDIPDGFDEFNLPSAILTVVIHSAVNLPTDLEIFAEANTGHTLEVNRPVNPGTVDDPGVTTVVIDDLGDFMTPIPTEITVSGTAIVGDGYNEGGVTDEDFVWASLQITSPLEIAISPTEYTGDINEADLSDADDEDIDRLHEGLVHVHLTNHLPLAASIKLHLAGDTTTITDNPQTIVGPVDIEAARIDGSGNATESVESDATVSLTYEDLQVLKNSTLYVLPVVTFPGTDGQTVKIVSTDFIDVEAYITVNVKMGDF